MSGERKSYYFTFGISHGYASRYVVIEAEDAGEARDEMLRRHGRQWAFQYDDTDWFRDGISQADRYNLTELV
jgi:hypothetical protein